MVQSCWLVSGAFLYDAKTKYSSGSYHNKDQQLPFQQQDATVVKRYGSKHRLKHTQAIPDAFISTEIDVDVLSIIK